MKSLYKALRQDPDSREGIITVTSSLGIVTNVLIALLKVVVGFFASSIAIISEGVNNATDALTSILTIAGTKIAKKHPDKNHPFGYGRIEYLTSLVISVLILVTGIEMLLSCVKLILKPETLKISYFSIIIISASAIIKFFLGIYTVRMGKKAESTALEAVGIECKNDCLVSVVTVFSAIIFIFFDFSLDAYAGVFTSLVIVKSGFDVLKETVSELIGRPGKHELATKIYDEIRHTDGIAAAADMMLHNYGPDSWSGSVNIEIDHKKTVGEIYQFIHSLQLKIMQKYKVAMIFGIYAVDNEQEEIRNLKRDISEFAKNSKHIKSFHAIYLDKKTDKIYCDFIVDYELKDWDGLKKSFCRYMKSLYPKNDIELTIETEFV